MGGVESNYAPYEAPCCFGKVIPIGWSHEFYMSCLFFSLHDMFLMKYSIR